MLNDHVHFVSQCSHQIIFVFFLFLFFLFQLEKLDKLSIIHVSGTKGKGSVCAFCESILQASGVKTGFYR